MTQATHNDIQRELGRLETMQEALDSRMDRFEKIVTDGFEKIDKKIDSISERITELEAAENKRSGAWTIGDRLLAAIGAVVFLAFSTALSWVVAHLKG